MIELLVVIAVIAILAALLLPALTKAKQKALAVGCLSNLKQLETCWHLYALDNHDVLPPNDSVMYMGGGSAATNVSWCPDHARSDLDTADLRRGVLFPYNTSVAIYHCPADKSTVETAAGQPLPQLRNRSYNMSQSVNGYPEYLIDLKVPGISDIPYWKKYTEIQRPIPSQLFVFIDEHPDTLLDAQFGNPAGLPYWPPMWFDIRLSSVARRVRWKQLMRDYAGKIDIALAKRFEADHFDTWRGKTMPGGRTLCGHFDLDPEGQGHDVPFDCSGTVDAKVVDAAMAKRLAFAARWGSACGVPFRAGKFLASHPQFEWLTDHLRDRPSQPWTTFHAGESSPK